MIDTSKSVRGIEVMKSLFAKRIICQNCKGFFKSKAERGKRRVYICTNYDSRNGKCDKRVAIPEQFLIDVIKKRYEIRNVEILIEDIRDKTEQIIIEDRLLFTIKMKDFDDPIIYSKTHINY